VLPHGPSYRASPRLYNWRRIGAGKAHKWGSQGKRSSLHGGGVRLNHLAGSGNPWWRLWGKLELELPDEEFLIDVQFGVTAENKRSTVGRREVNIKHLDGGELIEHGPGGKASSKRSEPGAQCDVQAVGHEGDEDVSFDAFDSLMIDWVRSFFKFLKAASISVSWI